MITQERGVSEQGLAQPAHGAAYTEPSVVKLVGGIIEDIQELFKAELELFQAEFQDDLRRTKEAGILLVGGALILLLGGIFLGLMCVHLLNDLAELPMWASFCIVGGTLAVIGVSLSLWGQKKFASFNPLPDKSVAALKEAIHGRFRSHQTTDGSPA